MGGVGDSLVGSDVQGNQPWLRSATWDLSFLILSIVIAVVPYSIYLIFGGKAFHTAEIPGTPAYHARTLVNTLVAVFVGGPHMYATFTRTVLDRQFLRRRVAFIASSFLIPFAVITMVVATYQTYVWLLSIFFTVASVHALHQIVWLTSAYTKKARRPLSLASQLIDYGVVITSIYPIAAWKMVQGRFKIGPMMLKHNEIMAGQWWMAYLSFAVFAVLLGVFVIKTVQEYHEGCFNIPKTLLISLTVVLMFLTPLFPNMDTSFQGVNIWHSFQYLVLTWHANKLREEQTGKRIGFLHVLGEGIEGSRSQGGSRLTLGALRGLRKIDRGTGWTTYYLLCMAMLILSPVLIAGTKVLWPHLHEGLPGGDEAYAYIGILSILLVHYAQDALLFCNPKSITG
jgi:hypothetical protein